MIVERTEYFAKPGMASEVLATRRRACAVRREISLASGNIFVAHPASEGETPDVTWECAFLDAEAHATDLAARAASPEFRAVRADMVRLLDRFARHVVERDDSPIANGMRPTTLDGLPIVPREVTFRSGGRDLKGYLWLPPPRALPVPDHQPRQRHRSRHLGRQPARHRDAADVLGDRLLPAPPARLRRVSRPRLA
jgi:hypothetical protein